MDGTYIYIRRPLVGGNSYFNRKQRHSVTLQGVCTRDRRLIHVSTGWPSAMHDTRIFNESDLSTSLPLLLQGTDFHLIADGGYQLSVHVMTPYTRNRRLNLVTMIIKIDKLHKLFFFILNSKRSDITLYCQETDRLLKELGLF